MTDFVLVHGGWQGAWCWYRVAPLLERLGHRVLTPDLPGHGRDRTPTERLTLRAYADRVAETLAETRAPAVLVGHSMGGMVISQAAADRPERVARLVYVAAFVPADGQSLAELARADADSLLEQNCSAEGAALRLRDEALRDVFFADCPEEDVALARRLMLPEPIGPLREPLRAQGDGIARVPCTYVECLDDRAISLARQRRMHSTRTWREILSLEAGHSPFFSMPQALAECLVRA